MLTPFEFGNIVKRAAFVPNLAQATQRGLLQRSRLVKELQEQVLSPDRWNEWLKKIPAGKTPYLPKLSPDKYPNPLEFSLPNALRNNLNKTQEQLDGVFASLKRKAH